MNTARPRHTLTLTAALLLSTTLPALAGTIDDAPFLGKSGDGLIFSDPDEGVLAPGLRGVTFLSTRVDDPDNPGDSLFLDPFENIITDYTTITSRGAAPNCLIANNPDVYCDSESGSGKRIKTYLTGPTPFDIRLSTTPSTLHPTVDYFTFGKVSNFTGARMTGLSLEILDADGNPMSDRAAAEAVLYNLDPAVMADLGNGARLPDGLFGEGGNEGAVGFFSDARAGLSLDRSDDVLAFGTTADLFSNPVYVANFGTGFLDDTMVPDGLFWDDNADPDDESALVAWNNHAGGGWTYGTLGVDDPATAGTNELDLRVEELATALGVTVAELDYVPGQLVPQAIVDVAQANGLFATDAIEDLRNANLNFTITVGNVAEGEFTLRFSPIFAPVVQMAGSQQQFAAAGYLDAAATVPFWDMGDAAEYQAGIDQILGLGSLGAQREAIDRTTFSFLSAFGGIGFETGRSQVRGLGFALPDSDGGFALSSRGSATTWSIADNVTGFLSLNGGKSTTDTTAASIGYDISQIGATTGFEATIDDTYSFGLQVGTSDVDADIHNGRGSISSNGLSAALFGRAKFGNGGVIQGMIGTQRLDFDISRSVMGMTARGDTEGNQTFAAVQAAYLFDVGNLAIGPMAGVEQYKLDVDGFTESGAGIWNLTVADQSSEVRVTTFGLRGAYSLPGTGATLTGLLTHNSADSDDAVVRSGFAGLPGLQMGVTGLDREWVDVGLGFNTSFDAGAGVAGQISAGYVGAFSDEYTSNAVQLSVNFSF